MQQMKQLMLWADPLVVGIDLHACGAVRLAFLNPEADEYPYTTDLHRCSNLKSLDRYWHERFTTQDNDIRIVAGLANCDPPGLRLWLAERRVNVLDLDGHDLRPFLQESADYEIPSRYRRAHALAQCAAVKVTTPHELAHLRDTLNELNFHLHAVERGLDRLTAACGRA